ncbi:type II secretion system F family protein [Crenobacter intestini]|uniref:Type II secretion system F family protein n=1 Tax=Crenobacter intestini TaxID=2563443 RepID=A0A4V4N8P2_9NEIS|nr:type II secretion system F family protein [Crenobacter intestini]TIC85243.1 type II secretion system F family protein [Crenobacter intestini]
MDFVLYAFIVAVFVAVVLLIDGSYLWWRGTHGSEIRRIESRLRAMAAGQHEHAAEQLLKTRLLDSAPGALKLLLGAPRLRLIERYLQQSGVRLNVASFLALCALAFLVTGGVLYALALPWWFALACAALAASLPVLWLTRKRAQRLQRIEAMLPDALDMMSRALRAGHAFLNTLKMVADDMDGPLADEFRITFDEINYGFSMQDALQSLAERVPLTDLRFFVLSVLIQRETGGNLSEVLGNISTLIRERLKLLGQVRVLSAEGRLSAWILTLLPFVLAGVINLVNPGFMKVLWEDPVGLNMLLAMLVMMVLGVLWMRRIIRIHI